MFPEEVPRGKGGTRFRPSILRSKETEKKRKRYRTKIYEPEARGGVGERLMKIREGGGAEMSKKEGLAVIRLLRGKEGGAESSNPAHGDEKRNEGEEAARYKAATNIRKSENVDKAARKKTGLTDIIRRSLERGRASMEKNHRLRRTE